MKRQGAKSAKESQRRLCEGVAFAVLGDQAEFEKDPDGDDEERENKPEGEDRNEKLKDAWPNSPGVEVMHSE